MSQVTLEQALERLRSKDVIAAFAKFYRDRNQENPESWPLELTGLEWTQTFSDFLTEYDL